MSDRKMVPKHFWIEQGRHYYACGDEGGKLAAPLPSEEEAPASLPDLVEELHRKNGMSACVRELLRVVAERDAANAAVAVLEENRREWLAWADSRKADLAAAEQRGAALAVEQVRDLVGGLHIDAPNNLTPGRERDVQEARNLGWNLALAQVEKALPPDLAAEAKRQGSTAGDLLAKYRPAPPVVVDALREAVEAFPAEPEPIRETIALELEAEAALRDGPTARLILEMAGLVRGKR